MSAPSLHIKSTDSDNLVVLVHVYTTDDYLSKQCIMMRIHRLAKLSNHGNHQPESWYVYRDTIITKVVVLNPCFSCTINVNAPNKLTH